MSNGHLPEYDPFDPMAQDEATGFYIPQALYSYNIEYKYMWMTRGHNCPVCNMMRGRVYSMRFWTQAVMPGFHPHCDCFLKLVAIEYPESDTDIFGIEAFIDALNLSAFWKYMLHSILPQNFRKSKELAESYALTGNWQEAFNIVEDQFKSYYGLIDLPRYRLFQPTFYRFTIDGNFTGLNFWEYPYTPKPYMPYEIYRGR